MRQTIKTLFISLFITSGISSYSFAGIDYTSSYPGECHADGDSGYCYGTMAGIRNQTAEMYRRAEFQKNSLDGSIFFLMIYNGSAYSCSVQTTPGDLWNQAMTGTGFFLVTWRNGQCNELVFSNGSPYRNAGAL